MHKGSCLCGDVRFVVDGDLNGVSCCHCRQCRKQSGHYWASINAADGDFAVTEARGLRWYAASDIANRGFCETCGSFLFWKHNDEDRISISASAFDTPTGLKLTRHIFVADKGDYYDLADGLPHRAQ